jgi:hypothetical protein
MFQKRYKLADPNVPSDWASSDLWRSWEVPLNVVRGESRRQTALWAMCGEPRRQGYLVAVEAKLRREPKNPVDKHAVRIEIQGEHVGYLARELAAQLSPALDKANCREFAIAAIIRGGSHRAQSLGVHLWLGRRLSPAPEIQLDDSFSRHREFLTAWPPWEGEGDDSPSIASRHAGRKSHVDVIKPFVTIEASEFLSGLSESVGEIKTGASRHTGRKPEVDLTNPLVTIKSTREFLEVEGEPVDRHFAFSQLEESLYKCRNLISGALDDFEKTCEQHHSEMNAIRPALIRDGGGIPMLPLYRQMAIMKAKAKDYDGAVRWCERGLEVYANDALRQEDVQDLRQRLTKLGQKPS